MIYFDGTKVIYQQFFLQSIDILRGLLPSSSEQPLTKEHVTRLYVFAIMWSIGALLELDERLKLQEYILDNNDRLELDLPALTEGANETVFEYYVDIEGKIIVKKMETGMPVPEAYSEPCQASKMDSRELFSQNAQKFENAEYASGVGEIFVRLT